MKALLLLLIASVCCPMPLRADMVTLRTNVSWNGTILSLTADKLTLRARFPNLPQKDLTFKRAELASIEFNSQKINEGDPPGALGAHDGPGATAQSEIRPKDKIVFREGGQEKPCAATAIDEKNIKCGDSAYDRTEGKIWRIYFANG